MRLTSRHLPTCTGGDDEDDDEDEDEENNTHNKQAATSVGNGNSGVRKPVATTRLHGRDNPQSVYLCFLPKGAQFSDREVGVLRVAHVVAVNLGVVAEQRHDFVHDGVADGHLRKKNGGGEGSKQRGGGGKSAGKYGVKTGSIRG